MTTVEALKVVREFRANVGIDAQDVYDPGIEELLTAAEVLAGPFLRSKGLEPPPLPEAAE